MPFAIRWLIHDTNLFPLPGELALPITMPLAFRFIPRITDLTMQVRPVSTTKLSLACNKFTAANRAFGVLRAIGIYNVCFNRILACGLVTNKAEPPLASSVQNCHIPYDTQGLLFNLDLISEPKNEIANIKSLNQMS